MAESEETKAAVEYWDRVAASAKRGSRVEPVHQTPENPVTGEFTLNRGEETKESDRAAARSRRR
jgi:hypothetical protein